MSRWPKLMTVCAAGLLVAACGRSETDTPFSPPAPRMDGGAALVGNATGPGTGTTTTSSSTGTTDGGTVPPDSTTRTGGTGLVGN